MREALKSIARRVKRDLMAVYFAARDPRTPWPVRLLALGVAAYALSPIDLIPDVIPVIGYLDDLILVPAGIWLVVKLIPREVLDDARHRASRSSLRPRGRAAAFAIVAIWLACAAALTWWAWRALRG